MDSGLTIRPVTGVAATDYVRPASAPVQQAIATQLAPAKTVAAVPDAAAIRNEAVSAQSAQSRVTLVDSATREVILRVIDSRTHQVIRQIPDQALMRMRAYARALQRGDTPARAHQRADLAI